MPDEVKKTIDVNIDKLNKILPRTVKFSGNKFSISKTMKVPEFLEKSINAIANDIKYRSIANVVSTCSDTGQMANSHKISKAKKEGNEIVIYIMNKSLQSLFAHEGTGIYGPKKTPYRSTGSHPMKITLKTPRQVQRAQAAGIADAKLGGVIKTYQVQGQRPNPFLRNAAGIDNSGAVNTARVAKFANIIRTYLRYIT
jgi:hypothetical protein